MTRGKIGGHFGKAENVLLTTTGRKSGKSRVTPLTATIDGDRVVLVASNGGAQAHPDWYLNLVASSSVTVQRGAISTPMRARVADAEERTALWVKVTSTYKGYSGYQAKTQREIPIVVCERVGI